MKDFRSLLHSPIECWYCCQPDLSKQDYELCKIRREKIKDLDDECGFRLEYAIITYYDGKEIFRGSLSDCQHWINEHWTERRYLDNYGKK